jgi:hypothetical protein
MQKGMSTWTPKHNPEPCIGFLAASNGEAGVMRAYLHIFGLIKNLMGHKFHTTLRLDSTTNRCETSKISKFSNHLKDTIAKLPFISAYNTALPHMNY